MAQLLEIKKGWYRTAGFQYGWINAGYEQEGIGINREALDADILEVKVSGVEYEVDCREALAFIRRFGSHKTMQGGTKVGFISKSIMREIE